MLEKRTDFDALYDNYSAALYGAIQGVLKDKDASHDALQEVFIKIWANYDTYDPNKSKLYTWMVNIARNHAIDKLRSKNALTKRRVYADKNYEHQFEMQTNMHVEAIGLSKLINRLHADQRIVIDLLYFKGFSQSQVAEQLNLPLGTVKTRVRTGVQKLRSYFVDYALS